MAKPSRTRGELEAQISEAITRFEKEHMGRGPLETKTYLVQDMIIVRLKGVLTKAEHQLVKSEGSSRTRDLIKQVRTELIETGRPALEGLVKSLTRRKVRSLHADLSTLTGERLMVFVLDRPPEFE